MRDAPERRTAPPRRPCGEQWCPAARGCTSPQRPLRRSCCPSPASLTPPASAPAGGVRAIQAFDASARRQPSPVRRPLQRPPGTHLRPEAHERVVLRVRHGPHVAAAAAAAAGRATVLHKLLAPEGHAAVAAVAGLDEDARRVEAPHLGGQALAAAASLLPILRVLVVEHLAIATELALRRGHEDVGVAALAPLLAPLAGHLEQPLRPVLRGRAAGHHPPPPAKVLLLLRRQAGLLLVLLRRRRAAARLHHALAPSARGRCHRAGRRSDGGARKTSRRRKQDAVHRRASRLRLGAPLRTINAWPQALP